MVLVESSSAAAAEAAAAVVAAVPVVPVEAVKTVELSRVGAGLACVVTASAVGEPEGVTLKDEGIAVAE